MHLLQSPSIPGRHLHHLSLEPLLRRISNDWLGEQCRFVVRRDPWRNALIRGIARDIAVYGGYELIMYSLYRRVCGKEMAYSDKKLVLVELTW